MFAFNSILIVCIFILKDIILHFGIFKKIQYCFFFQKEIYIKHGEIFNISVELTKYQTLLNRDANLN